MLNEKEAVFLYSLFFVKCQNGDLENRAYQDELQRIEIGDCDFVERCGGEDHREDECPCGAQSQVNRIGK